MSSKPRTKEDELRDALQIALTALATIGLSHAGNATGEHVVKTLKEINNFAPADEACNAK